MSREPWLDEQSEQNQNRPKCSLTRSELFLGESCTSSVHIKTEEAALTLSRKQMFWLNFTLAPKQIKWIMTCVSLNGISEFNTQYFFMGMVRFESQEYTLQGRMQFFAKLIQLTTEISG